MTFLGWSNCKPDVNNAVILQNLDVCETHEKMSKKNVVRYV